MPFRSDIVIIGAGVAGLAAAKVLTRAGVSVHLVEARERIGGRIFTLHEPGFGWPIELGAEFVHGRPPEIWEMLRGAGADAIEGKGVDWCSRQGRISTCDFFEKVDKFLERMEVTPADQTFRQFEDQHPDVPPEVKRDAEMYVEGFNAARAAEISVNSLVRAGKAEEEIGGERVFRIRGGYDFVPRTLLAQCDPHYLRISLNTVVTSVERGRGPVLVRARFGSHEVTFSAPRALITLPLGVLQAGSVRFVPALEQKGEALSQLVMGSVVRVTLRFREKFWDELEGSRGHTLENMRFLFSDNPYFPTWWTVAPLDAPVITAWAPAEKGQQLSGRGEDYIRERAIESLGSVLRVGNDLVSAMLERAYTHDWQTDPFSCGAYSYVRSGGDGAQQQLAQPVDDTLFFAGEATESEGHFATVHGAIATGYRAGRELLERAGRKAA
ncbi:MAG: flavin monoamine oxidase family protein [Terriglobales bacterium]